MIVLAAEAAHGQFNPWALVLGAVLLVLNGFFVAVEIALLAVRRARIEERADAGDPRAAVALAALKEISVTFSGAQLGITMASLGLGAIAEPALAALVDDLLAAVGLPAAPRGAIAFSIALSIVVFLHMVIGEMAPKNLALARPENVSLRLARPFHWFVVVLRPLIVGLNMAANGLVRMTGTRPIDEHDLVHTPEELAMALRESHRHGMLGSQDLRVMGAALRLAEIDAEAAMTPRTDLVTLPEGAPAQTILDAASQTGFTRFLVVHENLDDVVGLVHVKDALTRDAGDMPGLTVGDLMRPVLAVPENRELPELLAEMRADRSHAVLVVDEYGGTAGLVTLEDVIEELVGDIQDEFDPGSVLRRRMGRSGWVVDGTMRRDELEHLTGLRLPEGETETLNGFMVEQFGRLLRRGDTIVHEGWRLRVLATGGRRARRIQVKPPEATGDADDWR